MLEAEDIVKQKELLGSDIVEEALERYQQQWNREKDSRLEGVEDTLFAQSSKGQWNEVEEENNPDIPKYTLNKVAGAIDTIVGDQRQNEITIRVRPNGGGVDKDDAEVFNGLIKNIQANSNYKEINDSSFDQTLNSGYGGYRVITRYTDDDVNINSFNQEILIEPIDSAVTSLLFGPSKRYDKRDSLWALLMWDEDLDTFKAQYPNAMITDFADEKYLTGNCEGWFGGNKVRMAEYFRKVPVTKKLGLLSTGEVIDLEEKKDVLDELSAKGVTVIKNRELKTWQVERYVLNGAEVLKKKQKWAGKYIPLVPQYGKITKVQGQEYVRGLVRFAKDPSRIYNFARSTIAAVLAKSPKDPYWMTPAQMMGHQHKLERMNIDDDPILPYNPDEKAPGPPQRTGAPQVQSALIELASTSLMDIQQATNVHTGTASPNMGTDIDDRSGKAIIEQGRRGDVGGYIFMSNQGMSVQYLGDILVDLIPKIYDTTRQVRLMKENGDTEETVLNKTVFDEQTQQEVVLNDLSKGRYDVVVDIGPAFATQRIEAADRLIRLAEADPELREMSRDLLVQNLDLPAGASDELIKRTRMKAIQNGLTEPTEEEAEDMKPTEAQTRALETKQRREDAEINLIESQAIDLRSSAEGRIASSENKDFDSNKKAVESLKSMIDAIKVKQETGVPITIQDWDLLAGQMDIVEDSVQVLQPGPNSNQQDILPMQ